MAILGALIQHGDLILLPLEDEPHTRQILRISKKTLHIYNQKSWTALGVVNEQDTYMSLSMELIYINVLKKSDCIKPKSLRSIYFS